MMKTAYQDFKRQFLMPEFYFSLFGDNFISGSVAKPDNMLYVSGRDDYDKAEPKEKTAVADVGISYNSFDFIQNSMADFIGRFNFITSSMESFINKSFITNEVNKQYGNVENSYIYSDVNNNSVNSGGGEIAYWTNYFNNFSQNQSSGIAYVPFTNEIVGNKNSVWGGGDIYSQFYNSESRFETNSLIERMFMPYAINGISKTLSADNSISEKILNSNFNTDSSSSSVVINLGGITQNISGGESGVSADIGQEVAKCILNALNTTAEGVY